MPTTLFYSPKGGTGTSTVAAAFAVVASRDEAVAIMDAGPNRDLPAIFGLPTPADHDWSSLRVNESLRVITPEGTGALPEGLIVVDGSGLSDLELGRYASYATTRIMVVRPCYLTLLRAMHQTTGFTADGIVIVAEHGRALTVPDIEAVLDVPVIGTVDVDPAVARSLDAGLFAMRLPAVLDKECQRIAARLVLA